MSSKKIQFKNKAGLMLSGNLELPIHQKPKAYAIFAHCFTCNKNLNSVRSIQEALTQNGFGVLSIDFTGLGDSEGNFAQTNITTNIDDIVSVGNFLRLNYEAPSLLIGHSLGGIAVLHASKQIDEVKGVATIGAPFTPEHIQHLFKEDIAEITTKGSAHVSIANRNFEITSQFVEDIKQHSTSKLLGNLKKSLLFLHSPQDNVVGIENARELYDEAKHPKSFISLDGADHLLSDKEDALYAGNVISSWADRYISVPVQQVVPTHKDVVARIEDRFTTEIFAGKHLLRMDEPLKMGGDDFGPSPYEVLLASLGACTAMTLRMYADRKKWKVKDIRVHLSHRKEHRKDIETCEDKDAHIDFMERSIEIHGNLDEGQRNKMLEIAEKCPVHRTLMGEIQIETSLLK